MEQDAKPAMRGVWIDGRIHWANSDLEFQGYMLELQRSIERRATSVVVPTGAPMAPAGLGETLYGN